MSAKSKHWMRLCHLRGSDVDRIDNERDDMDMEPFE